MRKLTIAVVALTLLVAGYVLAQVTDKPRTMPFFGDAPKAQPAPVPVLPKNTKEPVRLSDQLALRIEGTHDGRVLGTLVANVDGRWVDVHLSSMNIRAGQQPAATPAIKR